MYVGAVALAITAAACSSSDSSDTAANATEPTQAEATPNVTDASGEVESAGTAPSAGTEPVDPGGGVPEALQFTAPLVGGGEFTGDAVAGKPTLFWFWAPT